MSVCLGLLVVGCGVVGALVVAQARVNRRVTRRPGFVIGGPTTRVDRETDQ